MLCTCTCLVCTLTQRLALVQGSGVAVIWGPPDYGDPRPHIARDIGMGITISLSDMGTPQVPITLVVWGSSVIWGSLTKATVSLSNQTFDTSQYKCNLWRTAMLSTKQRPFT